MLHQELEDKGVKYLFENVRYNGESEPFRAINHLALNWYRDNNGNDLLYSNGISIGPILTRRAFFDFCNDFKNYNALSYWLNEYEKIAIPEIHSASIQRVSKVLGNNLDVYESSNNNTDCYIPSCFEQADLSEPHIHSLSGFMRIVQTPFLRYIKKKRKILYIYDWSNIRSASRRKDFLLSNSRYHLQLV